MELADAVMAYVGLTSVRNATDQILLRDLGTVELAYSVSGAEPQLVSEGRMRLFVFFFVFSLLVYGGTLASTPPAARESCDLLSERALVRFQ
jgi:hypothetical protein